ICGRRAQARRRVAVGASRAPGRGRFTGTTGRGAYPGRQEGDGQGMSTVRLEAVKTNSEQEIPMQPASLDIWDKKYRLKTKAGEPVDADIDGTYQRVAKALAEAEPTPEKQKYWYERFLWALRRGAIPAGRITS